MKKNVAIVCATLIGFVPVSIALADSQVHVGVGVSASSVVQHGDDLDLGLQGNAQVQGNADVNENETSLEHGSTTRSQSGEKTGLLKHFGTTTPPGMMREGSSTKDQEQGEATSTEAHGDHGMFGGFPGFFRWLFGLSATTTVGEIRAQIAATTSASAQASTTALSPQGLGFWAHLLNFLHSGKWDAAQN